MIPFGVERVKAPDGSTRAQQFALSKSGEPIAITEYLTEIANNNNSTCVI